MKSATTALLLFAATAAGVAAYPFVHGSSTTPGNPPQTIAPAPQPAATQAARVDVAFVLDTTGSMSGLIQAAKEKIWSIASTLASGQPAPEIRMGLVAFRDRGDTYVTRVTDLSSDLDSVYATLMDFQAAGGGDGPESVNLALDHALNKLSWSQEPNTYRVIFLVGDAPPHMDYADETQWPHTVATAQSRGIRVNAVLCGTSQETGSTWQQIAQAGQGDYFQVDQDGSAVAITSPYDERLAALSKDLDATRLYYGSETVRAEKERKLDATAKLHESASVASRARRAAFNATLSGKENLLGKNELVDDVASGRVSLEEIAPTALPEPMQAMSQDEQKKVLAEATERRATLSEEIRQLADRRDAWLKDKVKAEGGAEASLDRKIYEAVKTQAAGAGLRYSADAPRY
ncbi:MAG: VWA domain-containing protein [Chromatiales bacterium]|nr:VWA domain-containing protein [Chromatiales bacterium]